MAGRNRERIEMLRQWLFHPLVTWQKQNRERAAEALHHLQSRYHTFRALLEDNNRSVSLLTDLGMKLRNENVDQKVRELTEELIEVTGNLVDKLDQLGGGESGRIAVLHDKLAERIGTLFAKLPHEKVSTPVVPLDIVTDDMRGLVGGKAAVLARLRRKGSFRVPAGFIIPLTSCRLFLEKENLNLRLNALLQPYLHDTAAELPASVEEEVYRRIMATPLPPSLHAALSEIAYPFLKNTGGSGLAVRSSAVGEDGLRLSFAGQYRSILHVVSQDMLEEAFKEVIASSFNKRNLSYRLYAGLNPLDFDLAVLCLSMVHAKAAGTLFTRDPNDSSSRQMLVSAVYGLGELAVAGSIMTDIYRPNRYSGLDPSPSITSKKRRLVCRNSGGVQEEDVPLVEQDKPALQPNQLVTLCSWGLAVEKLEHSPQDIEWAIDENDELVLLQARPFRMAGQALSAGRSANTDRKLLLSGGVIASRGEGTGRVWVVRSRADLRQPPAEPYVLVMSQSLVDAVPALRKARGVVVDLGNPVDHLSCVAREYGIAMVTGLGNAVERLQGLEWVMVDANEGRVWQPLDKDIEEALALAASMPGKEGMPEIPANPLAAELYKLIVPLNLTDAYGPTFSIAECRTLHDLIRFVHEKAVLAMFEMGDATLEKSTQAVRHLESDIPFIISIIDLGGGLHSQSRPVRWIKPFDIVSFPLNALWRGVADPNVNWGPPSGGVAMGSVMSRFLTDHKSARPVGLPNYAIITRDYLNLNARMDFHFIMIDSVCGIDSSSNYIRFRFKGGGTSVIQRRRRVQCIAEILESCGFACDAKDDLVTAELKGAPQQIIEEKLSVLGRLLGFTRLLDAAMRSDEIPGLAAAAFLAGNYQVSADLMSAEEEK
jgi:pyruvate,water dikinase